MQVLTIEERLERILEQIGRSSELSENPRGQICPDGETGKFSPVKQEEPCDQYTTFDQHSDWSDNW